MNYPNFQKQCQIIKFSYSILRKLYRVEIANLGKNPVAIANLRKQKLSIVIAIGLRSKQANFYFVLIFWKNILMIVSVASEIFWYLGKLCIKIILCYSCLLI
eukprot:TRINITY_DN3291_c4_g1_i6.p2 TRINITY_DN3291_c4_g1~~TRINITY_DN3291_c4_g1_i6.p2  ORF type:complete len:102 (-),score=0.65 TRINITY_DN3291_c4_g1_i6:451-756(-)